MVVVMPYFPKDLKRVLKSTRKHGEVFQDARAVRVMYHLLLAVRHLKAHAIVHRDIKLDNVLLANVGMEEEAAVLTDFGMCFDLKKHDIRDFRVMMPYDGFRRGGAPIALAPEITLPKPGPDVHLNYSKNDEWAVGMIAHEILSKEDTATPFEDMEHPATYSDAGYSAASISEPCRPLVAGLLKVDPAERLDAAEASRQAKKLQGECELAELLDAGSEYTAGALGRMNAALERSLQKETALWAELKAQRDACAEAASAALRAALFESSLPVVRDLLALYGEDKAHIVPQEAFATLEQRCSTMLEIESLQSRVASLTPEKEALAAQVQELQAELGDLATLDAEKGSWAAERAQLTAQVQALEAQIRAGGGAAAAAPAAEGPVIKITTKARFGWSRNVAFDVVNHSAAPIVVKSVWGRSDESSPVTDIRVLTRAGEVTPSHGESESGWDEVGTDGRFGTDSSEVHIRPVRVEPGATQGFCISTRRGRFINTPDERIAAKDDHVTIVGRGWNDCQGLGALFSKHFTLSGAVGYSVAGAQPGAPPGTEWTVSGAGSPEANGHYRKVTLPSYSGVQPFTNGRVAMFRWQRQHWVLSDLGSDLDNFDESRWLYKVPSSADSPPTSGWSAVGGRAPAPNVATPQSGPGAAVGGPLRFTKFGGELGDYVSADGATVGPNDSGEWYTAVCADSPMSAGVHQAEFGIDDEYFRLGVCDVSYDPSTHNRIACRERGMAWAYSPSRGMLEHNSDTTSWTGMTGARGGDTIQLTLDCAAGTLTVAKNGARMGVMCSDLAGKTLCWCATVGCGCKVTLRGTAAGAGAVAVAASSFDITGAAWPDVNGLYEIDATRDGVPSYRKGSSHQTMTRREGSWWIDYNHGGSPYYSIRSAADVPPAAGWGSDGCQSHSEQSSLPVRVMPHGAPPAALPMASSEDITSRCTVTASSREGSASKALHTNSGYWTSNGSRGEHWLELHPPQGGCITKVEFVTMSEGSYSPSTVEIQTRQAGRSGLGPTTRFDISDPREAGQHVTVFQGAAQAVRFFVKACADAGCDTRVGGLRVFGAAANPTSRSLVEEAAWRWLIKHGHRPVGLSASWCRRMRDMEVRTVRRMRDMEVRIRRMRDMEGGIERDMEVRAVWLEAGLQEEHHQQLLDFARDESTHGGGLTVRTGECVYTKATPHGWRHGDAVWHDSAKRMTFPEDLPKKQRQLVQQEARRLGLQTFSAHSHVRRKNWEFKGSGPRTIVITK